MQGPGPVATVAQIGEIVALLGGCKERIAKSGIACDIVSAGGTGSYQYTVKCPGVTEVQAGGDLASAQAALKVIGIPDPDALVKAPQTFEVPVRAPISGAVVEQAVSAGELVRPG